MLKNIIKVNQQQFTVEVQRPQIGNPDDQMMSIVDKDHQLAPSDRMQIIILLIMIMLGKKLIKINRQSKQLSSNLINRHLMQYISGLQLEKMAFQGAGLPVFGKKKQSYRRFRTILQLMIRKYMGLPAIMLDRGGAILPRYHNQQISLASIIGLIIRNQITGFKRVAPQ
ncbi:hypothetical protein FGO68_gene3766 [Halteria grandinella]|uniref:Uncharacterized protein n=1 Tax=Halteria grandinella TaxID=5974 RepID=A0A8J8NFD1_HALGN|nr:hypothetical protein FGO68_gene3766 [Halteria grandinella]